MELEAGSSSVSVVDRGAVDARAAAVRTVSVERWVQRRM